MSKAYVFINFSLFLKSNFVAVILDYTVVEKVEKWPGKKKEKKKKERNIGHYKKVQRYRT